MAINFNFHLIKTSIKKCRIMEIKITQLPA
jgi:hypothetical protein